MENIANTVKTVEEMGREYDLITFDLDVRNLNHQYKQDYGCYFAKVSAGEFVELWGCESSVPYIWKPVYKVL